MTKCAELGVNVALSEVWGKGGDGGIELAEEVLRLCEQPHTFRFAYELNQSIKAKIEEIVPQGLWRCGRAITAKDAAKSIATLESLGYRGAAHLHGKNPVFSV